MTNRRAGPVNQRAWTRTYRALEHRQAKNRLLQVRQDLPEPAQRFATTFALLQGQGETADYDPHPKLLRAEVVTLLDMAEATIQEYLAIPGNQRRAIATLVLLPERNTA